jgi:2-polyprenyl-6-hydroxyphenyl methylase/3-demethylubiquinone-9 3-methyltransferase
MLEVQDFKQKRFLDIGCGSGLFSLAARLLGASVYSFDNDPNSIECARILKEKYFPVDNQWTIEKNSVLNSEYVATLGRFDIVYSWGVLHHTGNMWQAFSNICSLVATGGLLFISIYNDQGRASRRWARIKKRYNVLPKVLRFLILMPAFIRLWLPTLLRDFFTLKPFKTWREYRRSRGMSPVYDVLDWVGGFPFEVAKPEQVFDFFYNNGFILTKLKTCAGGHGCNEFVFRRMS